MEWRWSVGPQEVGKRVQGLPELAQPANTVCRCVRCVDHNDNNLLLMGWRVCILHGGVITIGLTLPKQERKKGGGSNAKRKQTRGRESGRRERRVLTPFRQGTGRARRQPVPQGSLPLTMGGRVHPQLAPFASKESNGGKGEGSVFSTIRGPRPAPLFRGT